ncbi:MAG TPA: sulfotransferase [Caulobacteraceae bacterium]|nr:sulfotransferase [Caulobacteraceae bacterium]
MAKVASSGPSAETLRQVAGRLTAGGRLLEAIPVLERIVRLRPNDAAAHFSLGSAYLEAGRPAPAAAGLRRAVALKPTYAEALFNLGMALEQMGRTQDAIAALRKAVEIKPKMASAHYLLGLLLSGDGLVEEALPAFRRAAAVEPDTSIGRLAQARTLLAEQNFEEAEACLRQAIARDPGNRALHRLLANLLAEAGRFAEAESSFRQAIALGPDKVAVYRDFLMSKKLAASDRPLLDQMIEQFERGGVVGARRAELLFAIGKGHDDLGDYEAAMRCFDEANAVRRQTAAFDRDALARRATDIIAAFPPDLLARAADLGDPDRRPVLILGMPRSGTTLVEQIISSHSQAAAGGELQYWVSRARSLDTRSLGDTVAGLIGELAAGCRAELDRVSIHALRVTDKNPYNFEWIGLIKLVLPNARIIHCRRHPLDTCLSIYTTPFSTRTDYASDRGDIVFVYRQYLRLMEHWWQALPPGEIFEAPYEALVADPETWSRALIEFCGLEWEDACLRPDANPRVVRTASLWQARQPIYASSVERWRRYEPWLGELRELLDDGP